MNPWVAYDHQVSMDTDAVVRSRHLEVYRTMTPEQRVETAINMSEELRAITIAAIRSRNPSLTEREVMKTFIRITHNVEIDDQRTL